jgi:hypothetical protein
MIALKKIIRWWIFCKRNNVLKYSLVLVCVCASFFLIKKSIILVNYHSLQKPLSSSTHGKLIFFLIVLMINAERIVLHRKSFQFTTKNVTLLGYAICHSLTYPLPSSILYLCWLSIYIRYMDYCFLLVFF